MANNDYYVYEHIRNDTGKCFYVGKGHGKRAYQKSRNEHHDRVTNKTSFTIKIIKDNLTEEEAYKLEREVIEDYVFNKKYGIDIIGYNNNKDENGHLTNHSFGGDGSYGMIHSEEWKHQHSKDMVGEKNPMYGKPRPDGSGTPAIPIKVFKDTVLINTYPSISEAARQLGLSDGNIYLCLKGIRKHTKGYTFETA